MSDKKKTAGAKQSPTTVISSGPVCVAIHERMSVSGYRFYSLSLSRQWTNPTTRKKATGNSFFESDEPFLNRAIADAANWIREREQAPREVEADESAAPDQAENDFVGHSLDE